MRFDVQKRITSGEEQVDLTNLQIKDQEIEEIVTMMKQITPRLSVLFLDGNQLNDKGAIMLAKALADFERITLLSIQFNCIGKAGAIALYRLKNKFKDLTIAFRGNKIVNQIEMDNIAHLNPLI